MVESFGKIRAITMMAIEETLRRRVLHLVTLLVVIAAAGIGSGMGVLRMASEAGEIATAASISAGFVEMVLGLWSFAGMFLAIFLGATAISAEIAAKTIVNVLSRPVERSAYLAGRWLGILAFLCAFQLLGILLALIVGLVFDVPSTPTLWLVFAQMLINVALLSGVSLSLGVVMPALPAGVCAVLLSVLPSLTEELVKHPLWLFRLPAATLYYLVPAKMPIDLLSESFSKQMLSPDYSLYVQVLIENFLYALAVMVLACAVFSRKELRLR